MANEDLRFKESDFKENELFIIDSYHESPFFTNNEEPEFKGEGPSFDFEDNLTTFGCMIFFTEEGQAKEDKRRMINGIDDHSDGSITVFIHAKDEDDWVYDDACIKGSVSGRDIPMNIREIKDFVTKALGGLEMIKSIIKDYIDATRDYD